MVEVMRSNLWRSASSSRLLLSGYNRASSRSARDASDAPHSSTTAYYDILRVSPRATQAQIKAAYYKQAFMHHPDRNRGEEAARRFALIAEAYGVLGSVALRTRYDSGAMTPADAHAAWRRSSPRQRRATKPATNIRFDFDAHYRAHYGEELQRESRMRDKREEMQQHQREDFTRWRKRKVTVGLLLLSAALLLLNLRS